MHDAGLWAGNHMYTPRYLRSYCRRCPVAQAARVFGTPLPLGTATWNARVPTGSGF